jgi:hypothetical protein
MLPFIGSKERREMEAHVRCCAFVRIPSWRDYTSMTVRSMAELLVTSVLVRSYLSLLRWRALNVETFPPESCGRNSKW